ncbi:RHS repeat-associated core domain-containing protein [Flavihumibacter sp. CACIAM 22H1]|uniref:RHS repeat domain-containing protein n=1 Tax=Flavihumibacter sp. CACIAM 22H1 TaxID=1812911 RepID=UPI0025BFFDDC|nr:RHS repeat-associated core domain-containing protein [Flavihumibacter sp. CACIAM 22H1]
MGVYEQTGSSYKWAEQHLYGSIRLGIFKPAYEIPAAEPLGTDEYSDVNDPAANGIFGKKFFELSNHLGNVMVSVSDRTVQQMVGGNLVYRAEELSAQDYYAFGGLMPGRQVNVTDYRYGFNGKENDNEVKGAGNQQDYGMRIYDPRIGKFLSVDPLTNQFPFYTPYQFAGNTPIWATDLDGGEPNIALPRWLIFPEPILTLPKLPSIPVQPLPPIPPAIPQGFSMPQTPTLPPAPYMPLPPASPPITKSTPFDESGINPNDATTYPTPPFGGEWEVTPIKPGTKGYEKLKDKGATRLENEKGDVLRWHAPDKHHPKGHWDLKRGGNDNNPWENWTPDGIQIPDGKIYGKDFNPAVLMFTDPSTFPATQYPAYLQKQHQQFKKQMTEYNKQKADYDKKMKEYQDKMKEYQKKKEKYDKKMEQYRKNNPHLMA